MEMKSPVQCKTVSLMTLYSFLPSQPLIFLLAALNMEDGTQEEKERHQEPSSHHCILQITVQEAENQELPMRNVTIRGKFGIPSVNLNQDPISNP